MLMCSPVRDHGTADHNGWHRDLYPPFSAPVQAWVDDIVEGVVRTLDRTAQPDPDWDAEKPNPGELAVSSRRPSAWTGIVGAFSAEGVASTEFWD